MNQSHGTTYILWFAVGGIGLFILASYLISSGAFPSLPEYIAKVKQSTSTDIFSSLTSSSTAEISSSTIKSQDSAEASSSETAKLLRRLTDPSVFSDTSSDTIDTSASSTSVTDSSSPNSPYSELKQIKMAVPNGVLTAYVADTPTLQELGLSGKPPLDSGKGMIFIFKNQARYAFWMKDMLFPIDIIWIDANKRVVDVSTNISPATYPQTFMPTTPVLYVLEVNAGVAKKMQIQKGSTLVFSSPQ